jgi:hypothetical protein
MTVSNVLARARGECEGRSEPFPQNIDAEHASLGAVLADNEVSDLISDFPIPKSVLRADHARYKWERGTRRLRLLERW